MQRRRGPTGSPRFVALWLATSSVLLPFVRVEAQALPNESRETSTLAEDTIDEVGDTLSSTPVDSPPLIRAYGIVWAAIFTTQPVQSYGFPTATAPTAAVNPAIFPDAHAGLLSFQVQQSRAGVSVGEGSPVQGILEIDFIHFDLSSPTTQAIPRLRIAEIQWKPHKDHKLFFGQTWDIFGNAAGSLNSHSFNLVGSLFEAGNIGFMRIQLGWMGRFGDWELAAVSGLQGANSGPVYNNIEQSMTPTGSVRAMYHLSRHRGEIGIGGIGTSLRFTSGTVVERRAALGAVLFADLTLGAFELHAELYLAQNLQSMGALNLGRGRFGTTVADAGGYVSGKYTVGQHTLTAMFGAAAVLHPSRVVPGYTPVTVGATPLAAAPNPAAGPGIEHNLSGKIGYWFSPVRRLSIVLELYVFATRFKLDTLDVGRVAPDNVSFGGSLGSMLTF